MPASSAAMAPAASAGPELPKEIRRLDPTGSSTGMYLVSVGREVT
jgi:hypothetical protein